MKFLIFLLLSTGLIQAQANTEVYLLPIEKNNTSFSLGEPINISNNEGYDNQPSFYDNNTVLFSANSQGQTEIGKYTILDGKFCYLTDTDFGSEYSPTKIPNQNEVSAIRLDKDGKQLLYRYDFGIGESNILVKDLVIGYHTWANNRTLVSFVLGKPSSLVVSDIATGKNKKVDTNIGRSLHKIPNSKLISYISKKKAKWQIRSLNVETGKTKSIINTIPQVEDMCWTPNGTIFMAKERTIYQLNPNESLNWKLLKTFRNKDINNITRMTINKAGTYLGIVAEVSPEHIVQRQLDSYNNRDIDGFMNTFSNDIQLYNFANSLTTEGAEAVKKRYGDFFEKTPNLHSEIKNRIVIGNVVIDEEFITANDKTYAIVAIYEVVNGKISKARFIRPTEANVNPSVIEQQNKAYNNRDLESFLKVYDANLIMANYPNNATSNGKNTLAKLYRNIFKNVKDLSVKIDTRIICGNIIIDEEHHRFNGDTYPVVSIYKVANSKIISVTTIEE